MTNLEKQSGSIWLHDKVNADLIQIHNIRKVIFSGRTAFQSVEIVDSANFGVCLVLDGKIQSSQSDEIFYHEALVHPAMLAHPNPRTVFIAGGGEGATLRDVLYHSSVEKTVMVDIDKEVVDICHRMLPDVHRNSFEDSRAEIIFDDARKYLEQTNKKFDVAIIDLVEPLEIGPACLLYTREFYQLIKNRLNEGGIMSVQAGASGLPNLQNYSAIINTLKSTFSIVCPYQVYVPSFVDLWGFATASENLDPTKLSADEIDCRIRAKVSIEFKSYDGMSHIGMFTLSKYLRKVLNATDRIITDDHPIFV